MQKNNWVHVHDYIWEHAYMPSGSGRRTGDRVVLGSNRAGAASLRNFANSVCPALPVFRRRH